jgi:hypothetical protein
MASAAYRATINFADRFVPQKLRPLWEHPAGPKTVFFWSPLFKWVSLNTFLIKVLFVFLICKLVFITRAWC